MTLQQKNLVTAILVLASAVFFWPAGLLMLWFLSLVNGDIPTVEAKK